MGSKKLPSIARGILLVGLAVLVAAIPAGSFMEFLTWLAGATAAGVIATYALQVIRKISPIIDEDIAMIASVFIAALISVVAKVLLMKTGTTPPPIIDQNWQLICWLAEQLWYYIFRDTVPLYLAARSYRS